MARDTESAAASVARGFPEGETTTDRLWVNTERTVLVRLWANGTVEVARRESPEHTWGPPVYLTEER